MSYAGKFFAAPKTGAKAIVVEGFDPGYGDNQITQATGLGKSKGPAYLVVFERPGTKVSDRSGGNEKPKSGDEGRVSLMGNQVTFSHTTDLGPMGGSRQYRVTLDANGKPQCCPCGVVSKGFNSTQKPGIVWGDQMPGSKEGTMFIVAYDKPQEAESAAKWWTTMVNQ